MAFAASNNASEARSFSIGPLKVQLMKYTAASADVSGTVTADRLTTIMGIIVDGLQQTTAASFSGNVATLAFVDPAATVTGSIIVFGR